MAIHGRTFSTHEMWIITGDSRANSIAGWVGLALNFFKFCKLATGYIKGYKRINKKIRK
jgi:hypothetical protein